jgi:AcrR family transcriptional regulator
MTCSASSSAKSTRPRRGGRSRRAQVPRPRIPRQERARETVAAILEAAAQLIAKDGYAATSTNRIAARAGVSIGSLYQYFPNKEAILAGLIERHQQAVTPVIERSLEDFRNPAIPFDAALRGLFQRLAEVHADNPRLNRALTEEVPHPEGVRDLEREAVRAYVAQVTDILARRPEIRLAHHAAAGHVFVRTITTLSRWIVHDPPEDVSRDDLVDEAVRLLAAYARGG